MPAAKSFAAQSATSPLAPFGIQRRDVGDQDVQIKIEYCGVCHSDLHFARNEWKMTVYPIVPGHEILGSVTAVGAGVRDFTVGQRVAVGCMVDSCRTCPECRAGLEQYCNAMATFTYNGPDKHLGGMTYGGYSESIVVDRSFVLRVPQNLDPAGAAPLLCAGITTYSPLKHWGAGKGKKVGIVGLGGLGHMGVKLSHALGAETVLFTTSPGKVADGKRLGADHVVISRDADQMAKHAGSFDLIINTVAVAHDLDPFVGLLRRDGTMCLVGAPDQPHPSPSVMNLIFGRRSIAGSLIGGVRETQEMLDFCGQHDIVSEVEIIPIQQINAAYERMLKSDVKYRFVIDMATIKA
ncbi:MAG: NAD(P)-dependent alcohol dehydrogenase [Phycisphaerae bacterium]|nr:NAD(P)-dependent alcohol dehydrogenase [Phycisphaerae bacterium]